ncbi:hypothetical protein JYU34_009144 [Plutella xylostella]|uniref:CCHC-type domain-containing protein n=1 Tax=Plutella xylostella TaxID=51655 RepID=A0ABQ7QN87_PLUXY|nr:hypothetical protein JYU34_009144 [Plutella xylostella]
MEDENGNSQPPPSSDVGSMSVRHQEGGENEGDRWRILLEAQNANMRALIEALQAPKVSSNVELPEYDPEKIDTDAGSWCATAELCFDENQLQGGPLVLAISKALKGSASTWFSHTAYHGMQWSEFKTLFLTRFAANETLAGSLINFKNDKPSEKESLSAFANRMMTSLMNRWKDASKEQIAVATVLAQISQFDSRLQRLAFTTDISTRDKLQQELHAFSHLKRKMSHGGDSSSSAPDIKRPKMNIIKCFICGKPGHKRSECKSSSNRDRRPVASTSSQAAASQPAATRPLTCYKCGKPGHIAARCTASGAEGSGGAGATRSERRVDVCVVQPPTGTMVHKD